MGGKSGKSAVPVEPPKRGRDPSAATQRALWARSGGVCAWPGCQVLLYEDPLFFKTRHIGEMAHNVAASADGPRGHAIRSPQLSDDPNNLILLCPTHHSLVDKPGWENDYPETLLAQWKTQHEAAVQMAGLYSHGRPALGVRYIGIIGRQIAAGALSTIPAAMIQRGLILTQKPVDLAIDASAHAAQSPEYWRHVTAEVRRQVNLLQSSGGGRPAIALFGLADMPTLMTLGFALGHAAELYPFQWDRYAHSWVFPANDQASCDFRVDWPERFEGAIALVFSLSGPIAPERVRAALPDAAISIVHFTVDTPRLDLVQCAASVDAFRRELARVIERLERALPKTTEINVFPAMPASLAVAFGMAIKPKVSFLFHIYDAEGPQGAFHSALSLPSTTP